MSVALTAFLAACGGTTPPAETPAAPVPELAPVEGRWADVPIFVNTPANGEQVRMKVERALLRSGFRVMSSPAEARLHLSVQDDGGHNTGGIISRRSFSKNDRRLAAVVTLDGRSLFETHAHDAFTVTQRPQEESDSFIRRVTERSEASWERLANTLVNNLVSGLQAQTPPAQTSPAVETGTAI